MNQEQKRFGILIIPGLLAVMLISGIAGYQISKKDDARRIVNLQKIVDNLELQVNNLSEQLKGKSDQVGPINNQTGKWKAYNNDNFALLVPSDWDKKSDDPNGLESTKNNRYYLNFQVNNINQFKNETNKSLIKQGKLREYEQLRFNRLCEESGICGKIIQFQDISIKGGIAIEFTISSPGLSVEEQRGSTTTIYQTIIKGNREYRYWTHEEQAPEDLLDRYPKLDPSPIEFFKEIMKTLKID